MYYVTLKTQGELDDDQFQEVFALLDSVFDITKVLTFDAEGNKIETVATMDYIDEEDFGAEYEFDVAHKISYTEGDNLISQLDEVLKYDFELDAPITKEGLDEMRLHELAEAGRPMNDLDPTVAHDTDITMKADRVNDYDFDEPVDMQDLEKVSTEKNNEKLLKGLQTLPDRMRLILSMRFGFGKYEPMTLQQIADDFGVGAERIRQIEAKALRMLRHPNHGFKKDGLE